MKLTRQATRRVTWLAVSGLCVFSFLVAAGTTSAASATAEDWTLANVAVVNADGAREGSPLACVRDLVAQGMSATDALDRCLLDGELVPARAGIDSFFGLGGITASTSTGTASCGQSGNLRPELATEWSVAKHPSPQAPPNPNEGKLGGWALTEEYLALKAEAQEQWHDYYELLDKYTDEQGKWTPDERKQKLGELNTEHRQANEAIDKRDAWEPNTVQTDPNAVSFCVDMAAFLGECNSAGWKTSPCSIFLSQLEGCSDPTITDPHPDGDGTVGCNETPADTETVEKLAALVCHMRVQPLPGEDPCVPVESGGMLIDGWVRLAPCGPEGDHPYGPEGPTIPCDPGGDATPCGNPAALTQDSQCLVSIRVAQFGQKNIEEILAIAGDKLGGPGFVVPLPKVPPIPGGGGGPDPEGP